MVITQKSGFGIDMFFLTSCISQNTKKDKIKRHKGAKAKNAFFWNKHGFHMTIHEWYQMFELPSKLHSFLSMSENKNNKKRVKFKFLRNEGVFYNIKCNYWYWYGL